MIRLLAFVALLFANTAKAQEIVLGLNQNEVAITATFDGADILVFGAIKRDAPLIGGQLGIIIAVSGPQVPVTVRRKDQRLGIWVNAAAADMEAAPSFYAVASSAPLNEILTDGEDLTHSITLPRVIRSDETIGGDSGEFSEALIRIRSGEGLYQRLEGTVNFEEATLFDTAIRLPANLTEGDYPTRIFLTRDGQVVDIYETTIAVHKVGLERWLYNLAHDLPLVYGALSLALAIAAGWLASAAFTAFRR